MSQLFHINRDVSGVTHNRSDSWSVFLYAKKYASEVAGILIGIIAIVFCFHKLGLPSIWFDEAFSVELSRLPLPLLWHIITGVEPNMEFYYLFLHFWLQITSIFGVHQTEFIVRFPSALSASFAALIVYLLGKRVVGLAGGLLAALLFILCGLQLTYAQQTRSYAMQSLFLCITFFALIQVLTTDKRAVRWWSVYTLAMTLAVYSHIFSVLVLVAQGVALVGILLVPNVWQKRARVQFKTMVISYTMLAVLLLPMAYLGRNGSKTGWLPVPQRKDLIGLFRTFSGQHDTYLSLLTACIAVALLIVSISYILQYRTDIRERLGGWNTNLKKVLSQHELLPWLWLLLCWLFIPIIISFIISQGATRIFSSRYLVVVLPAFFLLVASGVTATRNRGLQLVLIVELVLLAFTSVPMYYRSAQVEDWNSASAWLRQHYQPKDGLVCFNNIQGCQISMEYYLHAYPDKNIRFTPDSPGYFSWEKYNMNDAGQALDTQRLAVFGKQHGRIFFIIARLSNNGEAAHVKATEKWLDVHFQYRDQLVTPTITIRVYDTASAT